MSALEKTPDETETRSRKLVMPDQINADGRLFGGQMMSWIDKIAAMTAQLHSNSEVVTASIDSLTFLAPVSLGDHVILVGRMVYVGRTSMEIRVDVWKENPIKGERAKCTQAYLTFVAIDKNGKALPVPRLKLSTEKEFRESERAREHIALRKKLAAQAEKD
ncbi:MAG: acyl-CoA thioesterase [Bdellovibrionota bacterium]